ncbi:MAG: pseudouridine-5'-phosphate glycosidase [Aggregatilineales bacterium]
MNISEQVQNALSAGKAVVALESTVITHGLAYPQNRDTALAMEAAIRESGAVPATIAILNGEITVGLTEDQIEYLAQKPSGTVRKCSRRDIPIAMGLKEDAATTVAGTMIVAHMAGIQVFATGGIGGVHRGHPFDVSADLLEFGRTPVTVVCAGAKSILDLPLTLEVLETQGVPVLGMQTDTLPSFYSRSSGLPVDAQVNSPAEVSAIIRAARAIDATHGILVAVPVPEDAAMSVEDAEAAIQQATEDAEKQGIHGKEVTPFVLARVADLTDGQSVKANHALLINNAKVASQIAINLNID